MHGFAVPPCLCIKAIACSAAPLPIVPAHGTPTLVARASRASWRRWRRHLLQLPLRSNVPKVQEFSAGSDQPLRLAAASNAALVTAAAVCAAQEDARVHLLRVALQCGLGVAIDALHTAAPAPSATESCKARLALAAMHRGMSGSASRQPAQLQPAASSAAATQAAQEGAAQRSNASGSPAAERWSQPGSGVGGGSGRTSREASWRTPAEPRLCRELSASCRGCHRQTTPSEEPAASRASQGQQRRLWACHGRACSMAASNSSGKPPHHPTLAPFAPPLPPHPPWLPTSSKLTRRHQLPVWRPGGPHHGVRMPLESRHLHVAPPCCGAAGLPPPHAGCAVVYCRHAGGERDGETQGGPQP